MRNEPKDVMADLDFLHDNFDVLKEKKEGVFRYTFTPVTDRKLSKGEVNA